MDKPRIVVIDADPKNLQILRDSLESANFQVTTSENGQDAWSAIQTFKPDIVVSEVDIPGIDGFQLLEKLQKDPLGVSTPMVFLTNRRNLQDRIKGLRTGVKDYMIKPLHVKEVIARLQMILRRLETFTEEDSAETTRKIVGRLEEHNVEKLVEGYGLERRTGVLAIYNQDSRNGEIYFRDGCVVNARLANFRAEKAVYQMLPWDQGHYIMTFKEVNMDDEITVSNLGLLLQGFKRLQERDKLLAGLPSLDKILVKTVIFDQVLSRKAIAPDALRFIALFDGQRTLADILTASTYDDLKTLKRITRLYEQGFIRPVGDESVHTPPTTMDDVEATETQEETVDLSGSAPITEELSRTVPSGNSRSPVPPEDTDSDTNLATPLDVEEPAENNSEALPADETWETVPTETLRPYDHYENGHEVESQPEVEPEANLTPDPSSEVLDETKDAEIESNPRPETLFDIAEQEALLEQPFDFNVTEEKLPFFMADLNEIDRHPPATEEPPQQQDKTEFAPFPVADEEEPVPPSGEAEPPLDTISANEQILEDGVTEQSKESDTSPAPYRFEEEEEEEPEPDSNESTVPAQPPHDVFVRNSNGASRQVDEATTGELNEICHQLFEKKPFTKGRLVVVGGQQDARNALISTLSQASFGTKRIGPSRDEIEIGRLQTSDKHVLEIIGLSTEKRFLQILESISETVLGYIVLVASDHATSLSYLGYLLNSLKSSLTVPHLVAVYQPENQRRIPVDFVRYSLNLPNEEQIVEVKPTDTDSLLYLLKQLQKPGAGPQRSTENEIQESF